MKRIIIIITIIAIFFVGGYLFMNKVNKRVPESSKLVDIIKEEDVLYGSS